VASIIQSGLPFVEEDPRNLRRGGGGVFLIQLMKSRNRRDVVASRTPAIDAPTAARKQQTRPGGS
jgi:hypothetical protein